MDSLKRDRLDAEKSKSQSKFRPYKRFRSISRFIWSANINKVFGNLLSVVSVRLNFKAQHIVNQENVQFFVAALHKFFVFSSRLNASLRAEYICLRLCGWIFHAAAFTDNNKFCHAVLQRGVRSKIRSKPCIRCFQVFSFYAVL